MQTSLRPVPARPPYLPRIPRTPYTAPLPHPSWRRDGGHDDHPASAIDASEFWRRLGL